jgi:hypothetical protein
MSSDLDDLADRLIAAFDSAAPLDPITGTLTDAWPIAPSETWSAGYGGLGLEGLTVTFE